MTHLGVVVEVWPVLATDRMLLNASGPLLRGPLRQGQDPDDAARDLVARWAPRWVHSTSWRTVGHVVLTYLAVCDEAVGGDVVEVDSYVDAMGERSGGDRHPPAAVLLHALRHLAFLLETDPELAGTLPGWPRLLQSHTPGLAGRLPPARSPAPAPAPSRGDGGPREPGGRS